MKVHPSRVPDRNASGTLPRPHGRRVAAVDTASSHRCGHVPSATRFDRLNRLEDANPVRPTLIGQAITKLRADYNAPREARWDPLRQGERHHPLKREIAAAGGPETKEGCQRAAQRVRWQPQRGERRKAVPAILRLAYPDITPRAPAIPAVAGLRAIRGRL